MKRKVICKAIIALAVALAFVMPGASVFANIGTIGVTSNSENTSDIEIMVESTNSDNSDSIETASDAEKPVIDTEESTIVNDAIVSATRGIIYVDDNRPPEWYDATHVKTITEGVTNATAGDLVYVYNGTYNEKVTVKKQLDLIGESRENVIVNGSGSGRVFYITTPATNVNISNFTITNGQYGIYITRDSNNIMNCNVYKNTARGIYLYGNSNTFTNCDVYNNNQYGISIIGSTNNFTNCNVYNNAQYGIYMMPSYITTTNNILAGNTIYDNGYTNFYITGTAVAHFTHDISTSNTVDGKPIYYLVNQADIILNETNNVGYLGLISCTNITAKNLDVYGVLLVSTTYSTILNVSSHNNVMVATTAIYGIRLMYSSNNNNITNCNAYNNNYGFYVYSSSNNNNITNCNAYNNKNIGFYIQTSSNNIITNSNAYNNDQRGFALWKNANNNIITNSNAYNNGLYGIYSYGNSNNNITNCNVYNNTQRGFFLESNANNNNIANCNVYNNAQYGIYIKKSSNDRLESNTIYDNGYNFYIEGTTIAHFTHDIHPSNTVDGKRIYYLVNQADIILDETNNIGYLGLISCTNITAKNSDVSCVLLVSTTYSTILNVSSHNSANGVYLWTSSNNNIMNCNVYNNTQHGIYLESSSNNIITNSNVYNNAQYGIYIKTSSNNNIMNCNVYNNTQHGIYLESSSNNIITNSNVYNNAQYGIYIKTSSNNGLEDNTIYDNFRNFCVDGTAIAHFIHDIPTSNTVDGKRIYYLINQADIVLDETNNVGYLGLISCTNITAKNSDVYGVLMINTTYSTISNVNVHDSNHGILLLISSSNNNIMDCTAYNNDQIGIYIESSSNNIIMNCTAYNNPRYGIRTTSCSNFIIKNCTAYNNGQYGIYLYTITNSIITDCNGYNNTYHGINIASNSNNDFTNCTAYNNPRYGFFLQSAKNNNFTNCNAYNNAQYGIQIAPYSDGNTITNCNAYNNAQRGISFQKAKNNILTNCNVYNNNEYGIYLTSSSNGNMIYHNNLINNVQNAYDACSNTWDDGYPSGGNYWSDYSGVDNYSGPGQNISGSDGIGDTPYNITGGSNQDRYPLMIIWDKIPPVITAVQATPYVQNTTLPVNITCTVTDNWDLVDTVKINITGPEGFTLETTMNEGSYWYEDTYATMGVYYYYIWANDTQGNIAVSDTYTFIIQEFEKPISAVNPLPLWKKTVPFTITATAYDNTGVENVTLWYRYSSNETEWTNWTSYDTDEEEPWSWSFTGVDGYYQFYSIAVDDYGNVEDPPGVADASTGIDTTKPVTNHTLDGTMGDNGWYISDVNVTLSATDNLSGVESTWYSIDSGYWRLYTAPFTVSGEGQHTVCYYSFDHAGNIEDPNCVDINIDETPPVTEHEFDGIIGDEGWFVSDVNVTLSATDALSGVNYTKYKVDDAEWTTYVESFVVTEDGDHTLYYYSVDLTGNIESTNEADFKIEHDTTPPETNHTFDGIMGDNNWYKSNVVVTLTAEDDSAGVDYTKYKLDEEEWAEYEGAFPVTEDANHTLCYYSVDRVGNEEPVNEVELKIDQTDPTINLTVEKTGLMKWLLTATVSDETSGINRVEFYLDGGYIGEATEPPYEWVCTKKGTARAIVYDNAGNDAVSDEVPVSQSQSQSSSNLVPLQRMISWIHGGLTGIQNTQRRV